MKHWQIKASDFVMGKIGPLEGSKHYVYFYISDRRHYVTHYYNGKLTVSDDKNKRMEVSIDEAERIQEELEHFKITPIIGTTI